MTTTFFGVQIALKLAFEHPLRADLADLATDSRTSTSLIAQRVCWTRIAAALEGAEKLATFGTWDLLRKTGQNDYEEWASGLEAMAGWSMDDFGTNGSHLLVSIIFLVVGGSNADLTLGDQCDLPERDWQRRATYAQLFAVPPMLNFTNVLGSGFYIAPRPDHAGFSTAVLTGEGFEYLAPITG